jgi:ribosome-binding factor A
LSSHRQEKLNSLLEQQVGQIILEEADIPPGVLVTVLGAETTEDFKEAKIAVSVFPFARSRQALEILNKNIYHLQQILNKKLRMRPVPKIIFKLDTSEEEADKVEKALKNG